MDILTNLRADYSNNWRNMELETMIKIYKNGRLRGIWDVTGLAIEKITPVLRWFYIKGYTFKYEKGK